MLMKWDFSLTKKEVGFFFFRMMMMGSIKAESCVDEVGFFFFRMMMMGSAEVQRAMLMKWEFSLTKNEVGFFTRDKSDLGKVTYMPEVGEYICVGWDVSTAV